MSHFVASRRYAKALFALSREQQVVEAVHADLSSVVGLLATSREWDLFVETPFGSVAMRAGIMKQLFGASLHPLTMKFLLFIDDKRRMNLLPSIHVEWISLSDEALGILRATAVSAVPLDPEQQRELTTRLSSRYGRTVVLTTSVDAALLGGLKILIGDHVLDFSIQTQLEQLQKNMIYA